MALNLQKLAAGRGSILLDDQSVVGYILKKLGLQEEIRNAGAYGSPLPMYPLFSPKNTKARTLSRLISEGVRGMRKSGEFQNILAKYGVKDWGPGFGRH